MGQTGNGCPAVGDQLRIDGVGVCEVMRSDRPSLVALKRPDGAVLHVGMQALMEMLQHTPDEQLRREENGVG